MVELDETQELEQLLKSYPNLKKTENGQRIKCCFTGHEMVVALKPIQQYIKGKKYKNYLANPDFNYAQFEPHLQPVVTPGTGKRKHKNEKEGRTENTAKEEEKKYLGLSHKQLYCSLTGRLLNKDPIHVLKHVNGYRYLREKRRYDDCKSKGIPYQPPTRSKQKHALKADENEEDTFDDDLDDKKFSTNPEISDSDDEAEEKAEKEVDKLEDLYPPEDFKVDGDAQKVVGEGGKAKKEDAASQSPDSSLSSDEDFEEDLSTSEEEARKNGHLPNFRGFPFKFGPAPPARKRRKRGGANRNKAVKVVKTYNLD